MSWVLTAGDVVTHYRVLSPLGSGGMGQVYLAEDVRLGRRLALKVLPPRAWRDEGRLRRFEREARTISALNHPNILLRARVSATTDNPNDSESNRPGLGEHLHREGQSRPATVDDVGPSRVFGNSGLTTGGPGDCGQHYRHVHRH